MCSVRSFLVSMFTFENKIVACVRVEYSSGIVRGAHASIGVLTDRGAGGAHAADGFRFINFNGAVDPALFALRHPQTHCSRPFAQS